MKRFLFICLGFVIWFFAVFRPLIANSIASLAISLPITHSDKAILLTTAAQFDPCSHDILALLGDSYIKSNNFSMGSLIYGKAMHCSPSDATLRYKFGESLLLMGFDGTQNIKDAQALEPNNPLFKTELKRLMALRLPSQSQQ